MTVLLLSGQEFIPFGFFLILQFSQMQQLKSIFISGLPVKRGQHIKCASVKAPNTSQPGESAAQLCSSG